MPLKLTGFAALRQPHSNDAAVLTTGLPPALSWVV